MSKKQGKNSKKAKKQQRKLQKAEARAAAKCTDLVVFEGVGGAKEPWEFDFEREKSLYSTKELRRIQKARQQTTTYALSTANSSGPVSVEQAEAFGRAIAAKYGARWYLAREQLATCSSAVDLEARAERLVSEIERLYRYEWKKTFGTAVLALDALSVCRDVSIAIYERGIGRRLNDSYDAAIDDFTLAIESNEPLMDKVLPLHARGQCFAIKGNLKAALVDFRAALVIMTRNLEQPGYQETRSYCQQDMLGAFVLQAKNEKRDTRPLFSKEQRYKIGEALGTGLYDLQQFCCDYCGSTNVSNVSEAGFCSRCELVCYCSADCHKQAWREHKSKCFRLRGFPLFMEDMYREAWEQSIADEKHGLSFPLSGKVVAQCLLRDENSGRLFEALSNRDVYFLPSELDLVPESHTRNAEQYIAECCDGQPAP